MKWYEFVKHVAEHFSKFAGTESCTCARCKQCFHNKLEDKKVSRTMTFFQLLRQANQLRQDEVFVHCKDWTSGQFACAIAGEVGELCNLVKKEFRGEPGQFDIASIASEIADVAIYLDLLAAKHGVVFDASCAEYDKTLTLGDNVLLLSYAAGKLSGLFFGSVQLSESFFPKALDVYESVNENLRHALKALFAIAAKYGVVLTLAIAEKFNYVSFLRQSRVFIAHEKLDSPNVEDAIVCAVGELSKNVTVSFNTLAKLVGEDDSLANVLLCASGIALKLQEPIGSEDFASMAFSAHESMQQADEQLKAETKSQSDVN